MVKEQNNVIVNDLYTTLASIGLLVGNVTFNFIPGVNIFFLIMSCITGGILVDDMLSTKYKKIFEKIGLITKDKQFPKHIKKEENQIEIKHFFKLPVGITYQDLLKRQDLIEGAFKRKVIIETEGGYATIREFKTQIAELKWNEIFNSIDFRNKDGESPKLLEVIETKIGNRFIFKLPYGFYFDEFEKYKPIFESAFLKPLKLELTKDYKLIVQIYDVQFKQRYKPEFNFRTDNKIIIPIGITLTIDGEQEIYLNLDENYHVLIGGINGSGKTSIINIIVTWACLHNIEVKIIDMKFGGDYMVFEKYKNLTAYINDADTAHKEADKEIKNLEKMMNDRATELRKTKCKNYKDYNKKYDNSMPPIIMIIDEYIELSDRNGFNNKLNKILAKARATNIKIILAVQKPSRDNLKTTLKANLNNSIAFMAKTVYDSETILNKGDYRAATDLHGEGEAILINNKDDVMFKSYYLTDNEIKKIIKPHCDNTKKADTIIEDSRIIPLVPKSKQLAVLEKSKVYDLL